MDMKEQPEAAEPAEPTAPPSGSTGKKKYVLLRIVPAVIVGIVILWALWMLTGPSQHANTPAGEARPERSLHRENGDQLAQADNSHASPKRGDTPQKQPVDAGSAGQGAAQHVQPSASEHPERESHDSAGMDKGHSSSETVSDHTPVKDTHGGPGTGDHAGVGAAAETPVKARGVRFVEATISVLDYELNQRFWGWRANDLIRVTDNVESMQLGVLEVVRRTSFMLAERISRHGVADVIDRNLESAMNWFMIKSDRYMLPSAEDKYNDGLDELREYAVRLQRGDALFYIRTDNLIPLLTSFADLVGSCDENLVKHHQKDGSPVSWFDVDDYFYYAKGVARAMGEILPAVKTEFSEVLKTRQVIDLIDHAIHACHEASHLSPWLITDAPLDGILANHRANMAAPISHVRYFLDALAKALST